MVKLATALATISSGISLVFEPALHVSHDIRIPPNPHASYCILCLRAFVWRYLVAVAVDEDQEEEENQRLL